MEIKKSQFWLAASIFVAILYSFSGLSLAFQSDYTIQDDARQHVFWLQKLNAPDLFLNDLIANYFSSVVPTGYKFLYWLANFCGIEPLLFNKILPGLLGVATTIYMFGVTIAIFPVPMAGFLASLLLNQNLWMLDDLVSGTPRAFFYVFFLGFIYYLLRQRLLLCLLFITLQGLFYPHIVLISAGILAINLIANNKKRYFYLIGLIFAIIVLAFYKLQTSDFNQVIDLATAKKLPEFYSGGRNAFFFDNPWYFWLSAPRSGWFPREWQYVLLCSFGLFFPLLVRYPQKFPLVKKLNSKVEIIGQILLASLGLFLLSHLLLFTLHLPARYSQHTWRIVIALVDGITVTILLHWLTNKITRYSRPLVPLITTLVIIALLYPSYAVQSYSYRLGYVTGEAVELYQFLQQQPKDVLIATLSIEGDFIPSFAQRSVVVAEEYSIPYHLDYYQLIRQRTQDLIKAQYTSNQKQLNQFIKKYGVDLWLLDKNAFTTKYLQKNSWLRQFQPETQQAIAFLKSTQQPLVARKTQQCRIFQTAKLELLDTQCLINH